MRGQPDIDRFLPIIRRGKVLGLCLGQRLQSLDGELKRLNASVDNMGEVSTGDLLNFGKLLLDRGSVVEGGRGAGLDRSLVRGQGSVVVLIGVR